MKSINIQFIFSLLFLTLQNFVYCNDETQKSRPNPSFRRLSSESSSESSDDDDDSDYSSYIVIVVVILVLGCLCSSFFKRRKFRSSKPVTNIKVTKSLKKINKRIEEINKKIKSEQNKAQIAEKKSKSDLKSDKIDQQDIENIPNIQVEQKFVEGIPIETVVISNKKTNKPTTQNEIPMMDAIVII